MADPHALRSILYDPPTGIPLTRIVTGHEDGAARATTRVSQGTTNEWLTLGEHADRDRALHGHASALAVARLCLDDEGTPWKEELWGGDHEECATVRQRAALLVARRAEWWPTAPPAEGRQRRLGW